MPAIARDELGVWIRYVHEITGIALDETKGYLIETRLGTMLRETGASTFSELYYKAKSDLGGALRRRIVDAITTNETSFFRDTTPFELLQHKLIPDLVDRRTPAGRKPVPIRIWSAACSTGQEAYSTAIVLKELLGDLSTYDIRIVGTDISDRAVALASRGCFSRFELDRGMPPDRLARHFVADDGQWRIRDDLRALVTFRTMNLLQPFAFPAPFDLVLCRNVAIYFNEADRTRLFRNIGQAMARDGALVIGATESIAGLCPEFEPRRYLRSVFYQLK